VIFNIGVARVTNGVHDPQIYRISNHFVLWEAVSQTKYCCSPKIKRFCPLPSCLHTKNFGLATPLFNYVQYTSDLLHLYKHCCSQVYVFDELFAKSDLDALREYIIKYGKFLDGNRVDFDSDNVDWIAVFTVDAFVHTKFWPVVQQIAHYITGRKLKLKNNSSNKFKAIDSARN